MGCYVDPDMESKEDFLDRDGEIFTGSKWKHVPVGMLPVCLIDNKHFTAAAIAYNKSRYDYLKQDDGREKVWYVVPIWKLNRVSQSLEEYLKVTEVL